jgi:hypothetical protein
MLTLDENHVYRDEQGRIVPRVTDIIRRVYGPAPGMEWATEFHLARGKAAHAVYDLLAREAIGDYDIDPALLPYIDGWRAWRSAWPCEVVESEIRLHHKTLGYAGTTDLVVMRAHRRFIVDFKQGCSDRDYLQLAAYAEAFWVHIDAVLPVQIDGKGGYKMGKIRDGRALDGLRNEWRSTLVVYRRMVKERGE